MVHARSCPPPCASATPPPEDESQLKLTWPRTSGYTRGNEARIGLDFFPGAKRKRVAERVGGEAKDRGGKGRERKGKRGREINYCHALNGCTCGLEASFFLSGASGN